MEQGPSLVPQATTITLSSILTSDMTSSSVRREKYYQASAYGTDYLEQTQYYPGSQFFTQHPTSSHREPSYPLPPTYVSPSLSESSYTDCLAANEYEIEDDNDIQSNSYYTSESRSRRGGSGMLCNDFTITDGRHNKQTTGNGHNLAIPAYDTAKMSTHFGPRFMEFDTPYYSPYYDMSPEELQPTSFSSNGYSCIGSQFQLDETQIFEWKPLVDPVFFHNSSTDVHYNPKSTAASEESFENDLLPFSPNSSTDGRVPPAVFSATDHVSDPYCDVSIPVLHTGRAVKPTNTTTSFPSASNCSATDPINPSSITSSIAPGEANHLIRPSNSIQPGYNASSRAAGTHISLPDPGTSQGYTGNSTFSSFKTVTEASSNTIIPFPRLSQETSRSLGSMETLTPDQPQAIDNYGPDESLVAVSVRNPSSSPPVSVTGPNSEYGFSNCPYKGCSTTTRKKHHRSNMRNHVRTRHEKSAPPMCELCGKKFEKNWDLERHVVGKRTHQFPLEKPVRIMRKTRADGTLYTTYQQVHDYVNEKIMENA